MSKITLLLSLVLLCFLRSTAQNTNQTTVISIDPASIEFLKKLNAEIVGLTDNELVIKKLLPFVKDKKIYVLVYVFHGKGKHDYILYDAVKNESVELNKMRFESKISLPKSIIQENQYALQQDTVVLLDTLKFSIASNSTKLLNQKYSLVLYNAAGQKRSTTNLRADQFAELRLYPRIWSNPAVYQKYEFLGSAPARKTLSKGCFYALSPGQLEELRYVIAAFISQEPEINFKAIKELTYAYLAIKYGKPLEDQVSKWLLTAYPQLSR